MKINSEGIYSSDVLEPYKENNICMTKTKDGNSYFFYICDENETEMPSTIKIDSHCPTTNAEVYLLGYDKPLTWEKKGKKGCEILIPEEMRNQPPCDYIWTIKISDIK